MATEVDRSADGGGVKARVVLQQCLSAKLLVQPASDERTPQFVHIGRGLVIYLCLLKGADADVLVKIVRSVLGARLSEADTGKLVSILDLPGDILIIPQATLGGALKGKVMQYHRNVAKDAGADLYAQFVGLCREAVAGSELCREAGVTVQCGTYGNRQVLNLDTNGPFTHLLEFQ